MTHIFLFTAISTMPAMLTGPSWSFDALHIIPALKKRPEYTEDSLAARVHILPLRNPFPPDGAPGALQVYDWLVSNYRPWNDSRNVFVQFQLCDHIIDCNVVPRAPTNNLPLAVKPSSSHRQILLAQWNGRADGFNSGNEAFCTSCVQRGKDIVLPTARNACGPYCGADRAELRRWAMWHARAPTEPLEALRYVESWPQRPVEVFWAGQVTPQQMNPAVDPKDDVSGRGVFYRTFFDRPGWSIHQTYSWAANKPVPLSVSMLEMMRNATFCFSPLGHVGGDTDRYLPALLTGCIPIMLTSVYESGRKQPVVPPLDDLIPWTKLAVLVDADDMHRLPDVLSRVDVAHRRYAVYKHWRQLLWTTAYAESEGDLWEDGTDDAVDALVRTFQIRAQHASSTN
jgi:hypothetical protein